MASTTITTMEPAPKSSSSPVERIRVIVGLALTVSALYFTLLWASHATIWLRASTSGVPQSVIDRWRRDDVVLTVLGLAVLAAAVTMWVPLARRRTGVFRGWVVAGGVLAIPVALIVVLLLSFLVRFAMGEGPQTIPARPLSTPPTTTTP
jgi:cytochrome bd-type quinol oxidase subunit 2